MSALVPSRSLTTTLANGALAATALVAITAFATPAFAQASPETGPMTDTPLPPDEKPSSPSARAADAAATADPNANTDDLVDLSMRRSWNEGRTRAFVATTLDVGWTYLRPRASVGYGKPFGTWIGFDVNPIISGAGIGAYAGLRIALPRLDIRVGPRYYFSFNRRYLNPRGSYNNLDLDSSLGGAARILTYEAEAEASAPFGPGDLVGLASVSYVTNVPDGQYVFEESLRMIVAPPLVWRARVGYVIRFGSFRQHSLGLVADFVDVPKRDDSKTMRLGPVVRVVLSRRVEIRGSFVATVVSPDHIGLVGGDFTELGFRYRWATE